MANPTSPLSPHIGPLSNRERLLRTVHGQPVDRGVNWEIGLWGQTIERWCNEGLPRDIDLDQLGSLMHGGEYFGLDRVDWFGIPCWPIPPFEYEVYEEDERYIVYRDGRGIVHRALKEGTVRGTRLSMDQYLSHPVTCREDFLAIKKRFNPKSPARYPLWWSDQVRILRGRDYPLILGYDGDFGFYWKLRELMGTEGVSYAFYDQPALIEEICEFLTDFFIETMHRAVDEVEFDIYIFAEDWAGKGGPLISPALFKRFFLPGYRRICDFLRSHGVQAIWVGSDGYFPQLIPLLFEAGVDGQGPTEVAAGMDPLWLRREFGPDLFIFGGIDKRELAKDRAAIDRELYSKLPPLLEQGKFIPTVDHTIPPDVPLANFEYYLERKQRLLEGHFS